MQKLALQNSDRKKTNSEDTKLLKFFDILYENIERILCMSYHIFSGMHIQH